MDSLHASGAALVLEDGNIAWPEGVADEYAIRQPLRWRGRTIGELVADRATPFRDADSELLASIATHAAVALEHGRAVMRGVLAQEIHHRVKNNLQTVAALLRLQSRRLTSAEARAALAEAERRVATIALVHETLSQTLDESVAFDDLIGRSLRLAADVATPGAHIQTRIEGSFGMVLAEDATALALVLTELVTNAVEHGFAGRDAGVVHIDVARVGEDLRVVVADDGVGVPDDRGAGSGLGTQIVATLVRNELRGKIEWRPREGGGTHVELHCRLRGNRDAATVA
jgi:two-component sensor histidine kinase